MAGLHRCGAAPFAEARLIHEPEIRLQVEAAKAWGVPPSVLAGRVVRPGEPEWTGLDSAYAEALTLIESLTCDGCGQDRRDSMSQENEFAYVVEAVRCHACAARDRHIARMNKEASTAGLSFVSKLREVVSDDG